jgi:hypothetical protein
MDYDAGKVGFTPTALLPVKKQFLCHLRAFALARCPAYKGESSGAAGLA